MHIFISDEGYGQTVKNTRNGKWKHVCNRR